MFLETPIKADEESIRKDEPAEAMSDITQILEHLSLELKLDNSDTDKQQKN